MPSDQINDLTLRCSHAEARSRLTRLIADGFQLHGAPQKDYETKFSAGTWDRQDGASALKEQLSCWCNNTVKSVLSSIFPTRAEWDQVTTVERPVVFSGGSRDCHVEGALEHFARILRELTAIRDSQLASYDPPNKVKEPPTDTQAPARHSADFTSVYWFGTTFSFNKTQAECVRLLWTEWEKGGLGLSEKTIGDKIGSSSERYRLAHTFRKGGGGMHLAWGAMIQSAGKGIFRLVRPESP